MFTQMHVVIVTTTWLIRTDIVGGIHQPTASEDNLADDKGVWAGALPVSFISKNPVDVRQPQTKVSAAVEHVDGSIEFDRHEARFGVMDMSQQHNNTAKEIIVSKKERCSGEEKPTGNDVNVDLEDKGHTGSEGGVDERGEHKYESKSEDGDSHGEYAEAASHLKAEVTKANRLDQSTKDYDTNELVPVKFQSSGSAWVQKANAPTSVHIGAASIASRPVKGAPPALTENRGFAQIASSPSGNGSVLEQSAGTLADGMDVATNVSILATPTEDVHVAQNNVLSLNATTVRLDGVHTHQFSLPGTVDSFPEPTAVAAMAKDSTTHRVTAAEIPPDSDGAAIIQGSSAAHVNVPSQASLTKGPPPMPSLDHGGEVLMPIAVGTVPDFPKLRAQQQTQHQQQQQQEQQQLGTVLPPMQGAPGDIMIRSGKGRNKKNGAERQNVASEIETEPFVNFDPEPEEKATTATKVAPAKEKSDLTLKEKATTPNNTSQGKPTEEANPGHQDHKLLALRNGKGRAKPSPDHNKGKGRLPANEKVQKIGKGRLSDAASMSSSGAHELKGGKGRISGPFELSTAQVQADVALAKESTVAATATAQSAQQAQEQVDTLTHNLRLQQQALDLTKSELAKAKLAQKETKRIAKEMSKDAVRQWDETQRVTGKKIEGLKKMAFHDVQLPSVHPKKAKAQSSVAGSVNTLSQDAAKLLTGKKMAGLKTMAFHDKQLPSVRPKVLKAQSSAAGSVETLSQDYVVPQQGASSGTAAPPLAKLATTTDYK
eukprot:TRINITY_DN6263_c1_g1_i10.p1 TRINITY_DN6263_c1_g1~~TRINITY_DN6263_c1_g1_i10.p1  ORF type:complete len:770 (+),score=156.52 TRINITY_DN6263_c1_g1_i10:95-2404(+)